MDQGDLSASSADGSGTSSSTESDRSQSDMLRLEEDTFPVTGWPKTGEGIISWESDEDFQSTLGYAHPSSPIQWEDQLSGYHTHERHLETLSQRPPVRSSYLVDGSVQTQLRAPVMPAPSTRPRHMRHGDESSMPSSAGRLISTKSHSIDPRLENDIPAAPSQLSGFPMLPLSRQQDSRNLQSTHRGRSGMPLRAEPPFTMLAQEDDDPSFGGYPYSSVPITKNEDMMDWADTASFQSPRNYRPRVTDSGDYANEADPNEGHLHWPTRPTIAGQGRRGSLDSMLSKVTASSGQTLVNLIDGAGFALTKDHLRQLWGGGPNASSTRTSTQRTNLTSGASLSP